MSFEIIIKFTKSSFFCDEYNKAMGQPYMAMGAQTTDFAGISPPSLS